MHQFQKYFKELPLSFFSRDTVTVARELLGKILVIGNCSGRIVETEAYGSDPASHAFRKTERSALMFDTFGQVYVYLIYGMYHCINFTTEISGTPGAVLIRALEPLEGISMMQKRRDIKKSRRNTKKNKIESKSQNNRNLCSGPGKLCEALAITKKLNGKQLGKEVKIYDDYFQVKEITASSRIGIKDALDLQWRFYIKGNEYVSRK